MDRNKKSMTLHTVFVLLCTVTLLGSAFAQDSKPTQEELRARLEKKLESGWIKNADWVTNYDEARKFAKESGKRIFAFFTRSHFDSEHCKRVEDGLLSSEEFAAWNDNVVAYLHVTTKLKDRKEDGLFRELLYRGYPPAIAFLDEEGRLLIKMHLGECDIGRLQEMESTAAARQAIRARAAKGDRAAIHLSFITDLELMLYSFAEASLVFERLRGRMPESLRAKAEQRLIDLQFQELRRDLEAELAAGLDQGEYHDRFVKLCLDFYEAGRPPEGEDGLLAAMIVLTAAKKAKDMDLYAAAHARYEKLMLGARDADAVPSDDPDTISDPGDTDDRSLAPRRDDGVRVYAALLKAADLVVALQENYVPGLRCERQEDESLEHWQDRELERLDRLRSTQPDPAEWPYEADDLDDGAIRLGHRVASTAIVCRALILAPGYDEKREHRYAVERATSFMLEQLGEIPLLASGGNDTSRGWAFAYCLEFLLEGLRLEIFDDETAPRVRETIPNLITCLADNSWPTGWTYGGSDPCSPFMTGAVLLSLYRARAQGFEVDPIVVERALKGLENSRIKKGRYAYSGGLNPAQEDRVFAAPFATVPGSIARSVVAELSLERAGRSTTERLRFAVNAFFEHWNELMKHKGRPGKHGAPYGIAPYYFMFAHHYAAAAIEALPDEERPALRSKLLDVLWQTRESDGGWNESAYPRNKSYSTAMVMLALMAPQMDPVPRWKAAR